MSDIQQPPDSNTSVSILSSRIVYNDKRSNQSAGKKRKYTEGDLKPPSQEVGCSVCKEGEARYKCPKCRYTYCSIDCCRVHKGFCSTASNPTYSDDVPHSDSTIHDSFSHTYHQMISGSSYLSASELKELQLDSKRRYNTFSELRQKVMDDQIDEDLRPGWNMSDEMVVAMKSSSWLRNELADVGLQQLISKVVTEPSRLLPNSRLSPHKQPTSMSFTTLREKVLHEMKDRYPRFQAFVDKLLCLTSVYERRPLKNGSLAPIDEWLLQKHDMSQGSVKDCELFLKPAPKKKRENIAKILPLTDETGSSSDTSDE
jgi:HIT zinc finger